MGIMNGRGKTMKKREEEEEEDFIGDRFKFFSYLLQMQCNLYAA
jgi:hypothetical protein